MAHSLDYFDATKSGVSSKVYEPVAMPEKKAPPPPAPRVADKPFYPAKPPKEGIYGTINKFPEHMEDPETVRWKAEQEKKKRESNMTPWKYEAWGKTAPTRSILFHHPGARTARRAARGLHAGMRRLAAGQSQPTSRLGSLTRPRTRLARPSARSAPPGISTLS